MIKKENIKSVEDFFEAMSGYMDDGDHMCVDTVEFEDILEYVVMNPCNDILYVYNRLDGLMTSEHEWDLCKIERYIRKKVHNFTERYSLALDYIYIHQCSLEHADSALWNDIIASAWEYMDDHNISISEEEIHDMF